MSSIITRLQLYLLCYYFMTVGRENGVGVRGTRREMESGAPPPPPTPTTPRNKYGFHKQKVCAKFPLFNAFGQAGIVG